MAKKKEKIVLLGGGFAGLNFCKKMRNKDVDILLVDRQNHHQFQPLFYQVASARIEPSTISFPFRKGFQNFKNVNFLLAEAQSIDADNKVLQTSEGTVDYDKLIIATGADTNFFGNEETEKHSLGMKTTFESISIRNELILNFEKIMALGESADDSYFNIVVVGGGATGVEMAGAFAEMKKHIIPKDYKGIDANRFNIILLEGSEHTLNAMSEKSKLHSQKYLEQLGVHVRTSIFVSSYDGEFVSLSDGSTIASKIVIWAAGIKGNVVEGLSNARMTKANRFIVDRFNKLDGYEDVYALGDIAYMETENYPNGHPQVANVANGQANNLAKNLLSKSSWREYEYKDLGSMATIGKYKAVVDLPFMHVKGVIAWLIWMFLHLMLILSARNKLFIFLNWAWSYLSNDTSLRLILKSQKHAKKK